MRLGLAWLLLALALPLAAQDAPPARPASSIPEAPPEGLIRVATLRYGGGKEPTCFAASFLDRVARETGANVQRTFDAVELASEELFGYPLVVFSGEGEFTLSDAEQANLRDYLRRGGFVLASASCSNREWIDSFHAAFAAVADGAELRPLTLDHPVFHTLYDIATLDLKKATADPAIFGHEIDGRLAIVFSPMGLNDTAGAGDGCCCCGGNEVRNAPQVNANILLYALTH